PKAVAGLAQAPEPVPDHAHLDTRARTLAERLEKRPTQLVVAEDVVLEQDRRARALDGGEPRVEVGASVDQQVDRVATDQRRARDSAERLAGEGTKQGAGRGRARQGGHGDTGLARGAMARARPGSRAARPWAALRPAAAGAPRPGAPWTTCPRAAPR